MISGFDKLPGKKIDNSFAKGFGAILIEFAFELFSGRPVTVLSIA
jgi:hypothetical protein